MDTTIIRKYLIKVLIGCLVATGIIAIVAILAGNMGEITGKALGTVLAAAVHVGIVLALIPPAPRAFPDTDLGRKQSVASNALTDAIIVLATISFFTWVLGIWEILSGSTLGKLSTTYFVFLIAFVTAKIVYDMQIVNEKLRYYAMGMYGLIGLLVFLLVGVIFEPSFADLGNGLYGRAIVAAFVAFVILALIMAILHRIFLQAHPELLPAAETTTDPKTGQPVPVSRQSMTAWQIILAILVLLLVIPLLSLIFGFISALSSRSV